MLSAGIVQAKNQPPDSPIAGAKSIVFVGNCQVRALLNLYKRFATEAAHQNLTLVLSYNDLSPQNREAIRSADLIVEQVLDFRAKTDLAGLETSATRIRVPVVNCGFLWPFAGQPHPNNPHRPYLEGGPYGMELSDAWLNRMIKRAVDPAAAVAEYMALDVNATVGLDRLYEITIDKQRQRDEATGFRIADIIATHFRDEPVFRTPYHPNRRIALAVAAQLFEKLGVSCDDTDRMERAIRLTPFPKHELPIHPSVCRHFGLRFVTADRRWKFMHEGAFTAREFALRYMTCTWNEPLEDGLEMLRRPQSLQDNAVLEQAYQKLTAGVARSSAAAAGHDGLANVLARLDRLDEAVRSARRAVELDPDEPSYRTRLGMLLRRTGDVMGAEQQLRRAAELDPFDPHPFGLLANALRDDERFEEAVAVLREGLENSPRAPGLNLALPSLLVRIGDDLGAETAFHLAIELNPKVGGAPDGLARLLARHGRMAEAIKAARRAVELRPDIVSYWANLCQLLIQQRAFADAEVLLQSAIERHPADAHLRGQLRRLHAAAGKVPA